MDYKEKFEGFLDKMQGLLDNAKKQGHIVVRVEDLENAFPELCEPDDEKIRKSLLRWIQSNSYTSIAGMPIKNIIAWLEKQEGCECIKKDWLEHIKQSWYKEGFIDGKYSDRTSKEWTKNDAATLKELIDFLENGTAKLQHDLTRYANWLKIQLTPIKKQGEQKPTDNDMVEALRTEYEKGRADAIAQMQKEWSEEDEEHIKRIIEHFEGRKKDLKTQWVAELHNKEIEWLKSLKDRYTWKPSDEQMSALENFIGTIPPYEPMFKVLKSLYNELKKL